MVQTAGAVLSLVFHLFHHNALLPCTALKKQTALPPLVSLGIGNWKAILDSKHASQYSGNCAYSCKLKKIFKGE